MIVECGTHPPGNGRELQLHQLRDQLANANLHSAGFFRRKLRALGNHEALLQRFEQHCGAAELTEGEKDRALHFLDLI